MTDPGSDSYHKRSEATRKLKPTAIKLYRHPFMDGLHADVWYKTKVERIWMIDGDEIDTIIGIIQAIPNKALKKP